MDYKIKFGWEGFFIAVVAAAGVFLEAFIAADWSQIKDMHLWLVESLQASARVGVAVLLTYIPKAVKKAMEVAKGGQ